MNNVQPCNKTLWHEGEAFESISLDEEIKTEKWRNLEVDGTGRLVISNTGGTSASEGGMGTGGGKDAEKGELNKIGEDKPAPTGNDQQDTFDPIKDNVEKETNKKD